MLIEKIINNNIISAFDATGKEVIVMGRGIGFGTKVGDEVVEDKIEKIFQIRNRSLARKLRELLADVPLEHAQISNDIITYAKEILGLRLNQSIYVTLTDHINFAIVRYSQGINPENALLLEIKRFYSEEYKLGQYAIAMIKERLHIDLPLDEAGFIALHFINAEYGEDIQVASGLPQMIERIVCMVEEEFHIKHSETSIHYERFVTHVKFLLQRIHQRLAPPMKNPELVEMTKREYIKEYTCATKIAQYVEQKTGYRVSEEEITYLAVHIRRIVIERTATKQEE